MPRVFDDPVAEPRCAAGGRSSNIISGRRDRPSSIESGAAAGVLAAN